VRIRRRGADEVVVSPAEAGAELERALAATGRVTFYGGDDASDTPAT
jgi:hypothetical protein